jgi:hypothetical protein
VATIACMQLWACWITCGMIVRASRTRMLAGTSPPGTPETYCLN